MKQVGRFGMRSVRGVASVAWVTCALACSEAGSSGEEGGGGAGGAGGAGAAAQGSGAGSTSEGVGTSTGGASTSSTGAGSPSTGGGSGVASVIVSEFSPGADWIEIQNASDVMADLGGMKIADDDGMGAPKLAEAIELPADTSLPPGAFLFVLAKQTVDPGAQAPQTLCDPGPSPCFYAPFGLSATGDTVYLLSPGDEIVDALVLPSTGVMAGESWCRVSGGAAEGQACQETPGAANASL